MKKFYNRKEELKLLEDHYKLANENLITEVIIGRRRIGKTELIKKYIATKTALYFYVTKKSSQILLDDFTTIVKTQFNFVPEKLISWEDFFNILFNLSEKTKFIIIFDEFQNFYHVDQSVYSILQKKIDEYKNKTKMHLLFIGSIQSMMEKIFMRKEPLFGRIDNFINLKSFNFTEVIEICKDHKIKNLEDIFRIFSIFNGVAKYYDVLEKFNLFRAPTRQLLEKVVLSKDSPLYKEGENLLIEEFGADYERYFDILFSISVGKTKLNEISDLMRLPGTTINKYLSVLVKKYKIVEKRVAKGDKNSRDSRYYLKDLFLKFWFRYVYKNFNQIELGELNSIFEKFEESFSIFQGMIFEELARELLLKNILKSAKFPYKPETIKNYWDRNQEFDIYSENKKFLMIGEIKLNKNAIDSRVIEKINNFALPFSKNKKIIKIIITFDKLKNKKIIGLLDKNDFYSFDLKALLNPALFKQ